MNKSCNRLPNAQPILSGIGEDKADDKDSGGRNTVNSNLRPYLPKSIKSLVNRMGGASNLPRLGLAKPINYSSHAIGNMSHFSSMPSFCESVKNEETKKQ